MPTTQNSSTSQTKTTFERLQSQRQLSWRRWLKAQYYDIRQLLLETRVPLIGLLLVLASGTLYFWLIYREEDEQRKVINLDFWESLFETLRMLLVAHAFGLPSDPLGRLLFFIIPLLGLIFVVQSVLDFGRLLLDKGGRIADWQVALASTTSNHIIVCGLGRVSYRVMLQLLDSGYDVVVIETNSLSEFVQEARSLYVPVIEGDARNAKILKQAGIHRARGMVAGVDNDLVNIEIALAARRLRADLRVVMRIFNDKLDARLKQSRFGPNSAFSSSAIAAPTLAAASVCRGISYALPLEDGMLGISEVIVTEGGKLDNLIWRIEQELHVQVIGYISRNGVWNLRPEPSIGLYGGDRVLLLGTLTHLSDAWSHGYLRNEIMARLGIEHLPEQPTERYNVVIVCGLGRVGYRVVKVLYQMRPRPEIIVVYDEQETQPEFVQDIGNLGVQMMPVQTVDERVLIQAGIHRAYSVAAITNNKLLNLEIGLTARHIRPDIHLVLRVFSDVLAEQLEGIFGIHTAFSTSAIAAPTLSAAAVLANMPYAVTAGDLLLATTTVAVQTGDEFVGKQICDLRARHGMVVAALWRNNERALAPNTELVLKQGDEITILADITTVDRMRRRGSARLKPTGLLQKSSLRVGPMKPPKHPAATPAPRPVATLPKPAEPAATDLAHSSQTWDNLLDELLQTEAPGDTFYRPAARDTTAPAPARESRQHGVSPNGDGPPAPVEQERGEDES